MNHRILIITGSYSPDWPVAAATAASKRAYAVRHGYAFLEFGPWPKDTFCWQKIELARHFLKSFDTVVWFDPDTLITNPAITVESLIDGEHGCFISHDWSVSDLLRMPKESWVSAGNIVFTKAADPLLCEMIRLHAMNANWNEQDVLQSVLTCRMPGWETVRALPGQTLNAVPREIQPSSNNPHDADCLLAHLTCVDDNARLRWIEKWENR